ncbi:MAG TPA: heparinase II/III family protein [Polyangia bacterium]|nr:heparinase II/III family protein [Polyangia bacterium]
MSGRLPLLAAAVALMAVVQGATHGRRRREPREQPLHPVAVEAHEPRAAHPRILLDDAALARLRRSAHARTPAWLALAADCDEQLAKPIRSGYEAFDWADAVADLALCWRATGDRKFSDGATRYLRALLDDREQVGDGHGGDLVVRHDDGYGIRSFGAFAALGYDWLWDAPSMTPELRALATKRLSAWLAWYGDKGYQRDHAIANYFCGYLLAESFAGLAVFGDSPEGARWLAHARDTLIGARLLPSLSQLDGGDWPEGWQYGELSAAEIALTAEAFRTATGTPLAARLPWLRQIAAHHLHALVPDGSALYDNGDWSEHPAKPSSLALAAIALALEPVDARGAAEARWLQKRTPWPGQRAWLGALADPLERAERDPHEGAPLSVELSGTGLAFMRASWAPDATWASFQCGPTIADHQHNDQGHFELWRGGDGLIVDGGGYGSASTMSHNSILVDDGKRHLTYPPNQGVWGRDMRTTRFHDDGREVIAAGEFADAYAPSCADDGCTPRSVRRARRTIVYVRPGVLLIDDRVTVDEPGFGVTWTAHFAAAPTVRWPLAGARVGRSRVDVQTLWPLDGKSAAVVEPTSTGEGPYRQNQPWLAGMRRLEIASATGDRERRFLHVISAGAADEAPPTTTRLDGRALSGVLLQGRAEAGRGLNVLFSDGEAGGEGEILAASESVIVAGLRPSAPYSVAARPLGAKCLLDVKPDPQGAARADAGGLLRLATPACRR